MTETPPRLHIETVSQMLGVLAEAAEVEHGVMCCYFFAAFGLKTESEDGLSPNLMATVRRWKSILMRLAFEEMSHLALVSNLMVSLGTRPHFTRQPFPVPAGTHPADIALALVPFDVDALDHFIFLERPLGSDAVDPPVFRSRVAYRRGGAFGRFFPSSQDYASIGDLYRELRLGIGRLANVLGEADLFCGGLEGQVGPELASLPGLISISNLADARRAIDTIVVQGEGSTEHGKESHYGQLCSIREEYQRILEGDPTFNPSRPVAANPVMRRTSVEGSEIHVDAPEAAATLDCANACYTLMLSCLTQAYGRPKGGDPDDQAVLLDVAIGLMGIVSVLGVQLTLAPASPAHPGLRAGMTFDAPRGLRPLLFGAPEWRILSLGIRRLSRAVGELQGTAACARLADVLDAFAVKLSTRTARARDTAGAR